MTVAEKKLEKIVRAVVQENNKELDKRFKKIDQRFEKVDQRFEKVDEKFKELTVFMLRNFPTKDELEERLERLATKEDLATLQGIVVDMDKWLKNDSVILEKLVVENKRRSEKNEEEIKMMKVALSSGV